MLTSSQNSTNKATITVRRLYDETHDATPFPQLEGTDLSKLSFKVEFHYQPSPQLFNFLKCMLLLSVLSPEALEEAAQELENIREFYSNRSTEPVQTSLPPQVVKGKIISTQTRPPLVLDFD